MIRVLLYLLLVVVIGAGFAWLANFPGDLVVTVHNTRITISLLTAFSGLLALLVLLMLAWWLIRMVVLSPLTLKQHWQSRRQHYGYACLSTGLIAALAGDAATARRMLHHSGRRLAHRKEPLLPLLEAQTKLLDLDHAGAIRLFEKMRQNPQTRLLALKGLYREAVKTGASEAASQYAQEAAQANPALKWASMATLEQLAAHGEWERALALFDRFARTQPKTAATHDRLARHRVVLMTGQAQDLFATHPDEARRLALKAHKLQPSFVPAANGAARILFALEEMRKGSKLIEALWKDKPHPDLGLTYVNAVQGESAAGRLKRARQLARHNPENRESHMLIARTAFEAGELTLARKHAEAVAGTSPTESTYLLLADIESAQTADQGKIRHWLAKAVQAKSDMAWIADGVSLPEWLPVSPVSGHLGACQWRTPASRQQAVGAAAADVPSPPAAEKTGKTAPLVIDAAVRDDTGKKPANRASKDAKVFAPAVVDPLTGPQVDVEPVQDKDEETTAAVTRIIVDDPGINDDEEEKDPLNNQFRLF